MDEKTRKLLMQDVIEQYIKYEKKILKLQRLTVISCTLSIILLVGMFFRVLG